MFLIISRVATTNQTLIYPFYHVQLSKHIVCNTNCYVLTIHIAGILSWCASMTIKPEMTLQYFLLVDYHCKIHTIYSLTAKQSCRLYKIIHTASEESGPLCYDYIRLAALLFSLTLWGLVYDVFVLRFRPKKQQFSIALPTP